MAVGGRRPRPAGVRRRGPPRRRRRGSRGPGARRRRAAPTRTARTASGSGPDRSVGGRTGGHARGSGRTSGGPGAGPRADGPWAGGRLAGGAARAEWVRGKRVRRRARVGGPPSAERSQPAVQLDPRCGSPGELPLHGRSLRPVGAAARRLQHRARARVGRGPTRDRQVRSGLRLRPARGRQQRPAAGPADGRRPGRPDGRRGDGVAPAPAGGARRAQPRRGGRHDLGRAAPATTSPDWC